MYKAKRKRHVCSTKGCRNREVILFAKSSEIGGGSYICRECIEQLSSFVGMFEDSDKAKKIVEAKKAREAVKEEKNAEKTVEKPKKNVKKESVKPAEDENTEETEE